mgnify:CR=1 FL=1
MPNIIKLPAGNFKGISGSLGKGFKKFLLKLGTRAFLVILLLLLITICFCAFLFYKYTALVKTADLEVSLIPAKFKETIYQSVIKEWQAREVIFNNPLQGDYTDPFE